MWYLPLNRNTKSSFIGRVVPDQEPKQSFRLGYFGSLCLFMLIFVGLWGVPKGAHADPPTAWGVCDPDGPGQCEKSVAIYHGGTTIIINVKNTSPVANGGFITADAFDLGVPVTNLQVLYGPVNFVLATDTINVSPFGSREFVITATTKGPDRTWWQGGGNPSGGLAPGQSATWQLTLGSPCTMTEWAIISSQVIRFRGFEDGDSDKDPVFSDN